MTISSGRWRRPSGGFGMESLSAAKRFWSVRSWDRKNNIKKEYSYEDYRSETGNFVGASAGAI